MDINAINIRLKELRNGNQLGLMAHAVVGYPTFDKSAQLIETLINAGSDFLELQIPFSDPVADGETIMKACEVALRNGMNTDKAFEMIENIISKTRKYHFSLSRHSVNSPFFPILIMAYYNTVFRYGIERFCKRSKNLRVSGLIVPDIPPEEEKSEKFISTCLKYNIYPIRVVSPSSSIYRLEINARFTRGFVYCVSHYGVTGSKAEVDSKLLNYLQRVKQVMKLPVAVGFGIDKKEQVERLKRIADMAIVGSAIIKNYDAGGISTVDPFIKHLKESTI